MYIYIHRATRGRQTSCTAQCPHCIWQTSTRTHWLDIRVYQSFWSSGRKRLDVLYWTLVYLYSTVLNYTLVPAVHTAGGSWKLLTLEGGGRRGREGRRRRVGQRALRGVSRGYRHLPVHVHCWGGGWTTRLSAAAAHLVPREHVLAHVVVHGRYLKREKKYLIKVTLKFKKKRQYNQNRRKMTFLSNWFIE